MKIILAVPVILLLLCIKTDAQIQGWYYYTNDKGDTIRGSNDYGSRLYDVNKCYCPGKPEIDKDGHHLLPANHPSAKDFNNPKHWYWKNVSDELPELGGYWEVKPEYMDSIPDGDGGWLKAAFWTIERWKKEEKEKQQRNDDFLKPEWPKMDSLKVEPTL